nr:cytochrome c biogenesis protein CcsA [uncultured Porphyromonas sp.]
MKWRRRAGGVTFALLALLLLILAGGTVVERMQGHEVAIRQIYGAPWMIALWLLAGLGLLCSLVRGGRRLPAATLILHLSLLLILVGGFCTALLSRQGKMVIRQGSPSERFVLSGGTATDSLPFPIVLRDYGTTYSDEARVFPSDYYAEIEVEGSAHRLSMNKILRHRGYRFFLHALSEESDEVSLLVTYDPLGMYLVYAGFLLLIVAFLMLMLQREGRFRRLLRRAILPLALLCPLIATEAHAEEPAVYYQGRVVPLSTLSRDIALKTTGSARGHRELLRRWVTDFDSCKREPLIRIKGRELREQTHLPGRVALTDLFSPERGYLLQPYLKAYDEGDDSPATRQAVAVSESVELAFSIRMGETLYLFPSRTSAGKVKWFAAGSPIAPGEVAERDSLFIRTFMPTLISNRNSPEEYRQLIDALVAYQDQVPEVKSSRPRLRAEVLYHSAPYPLILFITYFILALLALTLPRIFSGKVVRWGLLAGLLFLTLFIGCRAYITGRVPLATGYETSLAIAWSITLLGLLLVRRVAPLGALCMGGAGFFLLVAHLGMSSPAMTPIMPVLHSPLLSLHVSVLMVSYALLSTTAAIGLYSLLGRQSREQVRRQRDLSLLLLYPALLLLIVGIVIGAYWANVSWGCYWSWDPKEVWALITLVAYSALLHEGLLPWLRDPRHFHLCMVLLFAVLLMTYFGVNTLLGGLHSYG